MFFVLLLRLENQEQRYCLQTDVLMICLTFKVTVQYMQDRGAVLPIRVHTIVISVQHDEEVCLDEMRDALKEKVIKAVVPAKYLDEDTIYHLQPSGRFVIGGPQVRPYNVSSACFFESYHGYLKKFGYFHLSSRFFGSLHVAAEDIC